MDEIKILELKEGILGQNDADAKALRKKLREDGIFLLNIMSSPGSGKTSLILALEKYLSRQISFGVMEADIDSDTDAKKLCAAGIPAIQLHTGGMCHLDAEMTRQGICGFDEKPELIILENVGNLVCPAEFDTGAAMNLTILSVPEGDDKPAKYPLMYETSDVLVINKTDTLPVFNFDMELVGARAKKCREDIKIFAVSAKTGEGVRELAEYIIKNVREWKNE